MCSRPDNSECQVFRLYFEGAGPAKDRTRLIRQEYEEGSGRLPERLLFGVDGGGLARGGGDCAR